VKAAAFGLSLIVLALPFAAHADESLVAKREACRQEARARIVSKRRIGVDEFRRIVERRAAHVTQCMSRTVVARSDHPLPPARTIDAASGRHQEPTTGSVGKTRPQSLTKGDGRKPRLSSRRIVKGKKRTRWSRLGQ
jgi:hypothetical protein